MSFRNGFFNGIEGDRKYFTTDFNYYFAGFIPNRGVLATASESFRVEPLENKFGIRIRPGRGMIYARWCNNDEDYEYIFQKGTSVKHYEIGFVVSGSSGALGIPDENDDNRKIVWRVQEYDGTNKTSYSNMIYLARVKVDPCKDRIDWGDIDVVTGTSETPYIISMMTIANYSSKIASWKKTFYDWFNELVKKLENPDLNDYFSDIIADAINRINGLNDRVDDLKETLNTIIETKLFYKEFNSSGSWTVPGYIRDNKIVKIEAYGAPGGGGTGGYGGAGGTGGKGGNGTYGTCDSGFGAHIGDIQFAFPDLYGSWPQYSNTVVPGGSGTGGGAGGSGYTGGAGLSGFLPPKLSWSNIVTREGVKFDVIIGVAGGPRGDGGTTSIKYLTNTLSARGGYGGDDGGNAPGGVNGKDGDTTYPVPKFSVISTPYAADQNGKTIIYYSSTGLQTVVGANGGNGSSAMRSLNDNDIYREEKDIQSRASMTIYREGVAVKTISGGNGGAGGAPGYGGFGGGGGGAINTGITVSSPGGTVPGSESSIVILPSYLYSVNDGTPGSGAKSSTDASRSGQDGNGISGGNGGSGTPGCIGYQGSGGSGNGYVCIFYKIKNMLTMKKDDNIKTIDEIKK